MHGLPNSWSKKLSEEICIRCLSPAEEDLTLCPECFDEDQNELNFQLMRDEF